MSRFFQEDGRVLPVTVIEAGPCPVVQVKQPPSGRSAVQLGYGEQKAKHAARAEVGHAKRATLEHAPRVLRDFPLETEAAVPNVGDVVTVDIFQVGDRVKVTGTTKGHGFQGVVKRHGFSGGPASHGSTRYRKPGSIGPGTDPSRVMTGKKLPGQHGNTRHTETGLTVVKVDTEQNLLFLQGAVPGARNGLVFVRKQGKRSRYA
jgi:large subunit ribosomal protein L3